MKSKARNGRLWIVAAIFPVSSFSPKRIIIFILKKVFLKKIH